MIAAGRQLWCRARPAVVIALGALLLAAPVARAAEPANRAFSEAGSFEGKASPSGSFEGACGLAVDSFGDVYVSDYYHHVVDVFDSNHQYITQLKLPRTNGPCGLAVDSSGRLYVDTYHEVVTRYAPSSYPPSAGTTYAGATVLDSGHATGIALDPASGDLYVDDRTAVREFSPAGAPIGQIELGPLADAYGVAVSDFAATEGEVYVADVASGQVEAFDAGGTLVATIDGAGTPQGGFHSLVDAALAIDQSNGNLSVVDDTEPGFEAPAAVIDEFNPAGDYRGQVPHALVDGEPTGLALQSSGRLYVGSGNGPGAFVYEFGASVPEHLLTVAVVGEGSGAVRSAPAGIACPGACTGEYAPEARVTLIATPAAGSVFSGWSGCPQESGSECVAGAADQTITATFALAPVTMATHAAILSAPGEAPAAAPAATRSPAGLAVHSADALLTVLPPSPGTLSVEGPDLAPLGRRLGVEGASLRPRLDRRGLRALGRAKGGVLRTPARLRFEPDGGGPALTARTRITFRQVSDERKR